MYFSALLQAELDKSQKDVEDLLAAGVKKRTCQRSLWAKRKESWNEEEEDLEVLDARW